MKEHVHFKVYQLTGVVCPNKHCKCFFRKTIPYPHLTLSVESLFNSNFGSHNCWLFSLDIPHKHGQATQTHNWHCHPRCETIFPQQRKLMGSSAQISSGVCRRGLQEQVPEEGSGEFRRVPASAGVGSGGRFR